MPGLFPSSSSSSQQQHTPVSLQEIFHTPSLSKSGSDKKSVRVLYCGRADWERLWVYKSTTHTPLGDIVDAIMTHYLVDIPDSLLRHLPKEKIDSSTIEAHSVRVDTNLYERLKDFCRENNTTVATVSNLMFTLYPLRQASEEH